MLFPIFGNLYSVRILDSVFWGPDHVGYLRIKLMHLLWVLGVFLGGIWDYGHKFTQIIAGINTDLYYSIIIHI